MNRKKQQQQKKNRAMKISLNYPLDSASQSFDLHVDWLFIKWEAIIICMTIILSKSGGNKCNKIATVWAVPTVSNNII